MTRRPRFFLVLTLLSGASALLYQVVWSRRLTLDIGLTAAAISTVLVAFMGGLALGAASTGRVAATLSRRRALRWYAVLELAIGLAALAVAPALAQARRFLAAAYHDGDGGFLFALLRLLICLLIVTIPATLMGATVPLAVRWLERRSVHASQTAGVFYAVSTFGAAVGAALTGFVLVPALGLHQATLVGAALNAIVAAGAGWLSIGRDEGEDLRAIAIGEPWSAIPPSNAGDRLTQGLAPNGGPVRAHPGSAAVTLAISGFVALVHDVAWTRVIALTLGPTTYAFSTMLATCIFGLAAGAALATRVLPRLRRPVKGLALTQVAAALGAFIAAALVPRLPGVVASLVTPPHGFGSTLASESLLIALLLLPMTVALGAAFPFAVATAAPTGTEAARETSFLYTVNMLGAIGGALAGGFVLIPQIGLQRTIVFAGLIGVLAGVELIWRTRRRGHSRIWLPMLGLVTAAFGIALPQWNAAQLVSGAYRQRDRASPPDIRSGIEAGALLFYDDGAAGTVSVQRLAGTIALAINGTLDASNAGDMLRQTVLAHLSLLLHHAPRGVCVIGLGSGVTAGAALAHPVDRVDTIELSREVVRASDFFSTENRAALRDPRHHLFVGDGRTHLRLASRKYDVIVSQPSSPWVAGTAPLFTRELFEAARDRLNAGGLFGQHLHLADLDRRDLLSILATFTSVFPHTSLWLIGDTDLIAIGGAEPMTPRIAQLARRWQAPGVATDLERVQVRDPFSLLSSFVMDDTVIGPLVRGAELQTDDRPRLELTGPWMLQAQSDHAAWLMEQRFRDARPAAIREAEANATGPQWRNRALMLLDTGAEARAYDAAARALTFDPTDAESLALITKAAVVLGWQKEALALLDRIRARAPGNLAPLIALSRLRAIVGDADGAVEAATAGTRAFPDAFESWQQLATLFADRRDETRLAQAFESLEAQFPTRWETRYFEAVLHLLRGELTVAVSIGEQVLKGRPSDPRTLALLGAAYARLGIHTRARDALEACIQSNPRDPEGYVQLARMELETFNAPRAAALFSEALVLNPRLPSALRGLADALSRMGRGDRAAELRARAGS